MTYRNLEKLAANVRDLRRFARQHIWNAPNRGFGENAEWAMTELREARRALRDEQRASARWASSPDGAQDELEARAERHREEMKKWERERQAALAEWGDDPSRQEKLERANEKSRNLAAKYLGRGDDPDEVQEWLTEALGNNENALGPLSQLREAPVLLTTPPINPHKIRINTLIEPRIKDLRDLAGGFGRGQVASYNATDDHLNLHGRKDGPGDRLGSALHENNERRATQRIERAMGRRYADSQGPMPRLASDVLSQSSHMTPSVPLRDINIANTAWGDDAATYAEAANLQDSRMRLRLIPRGGFPVSEIREIGQKVPGAQRILENARILPGAPVPATPGYVQHAQQRLIGAGAEAPPSPAVQQRLQQIIDRHEASIAPPSHPRLNRNELRMIDNSFDRTYNPEFPQLLAKRVPSPQAPATPLPAEQRSAFRDALAAQPGLTRKQFLAQ